MAEAERMVEAAVEESDRQAEDNLRCSGLYTFCVTWGPLLLVLAGAALRLRQYLANRSLWLDEAAKAHGILSTQWDGLHLPFAHEPGHTLPIAFTGTTKLCVEFLGANEYALRLTPLAGGVAALVLFYFLARRCLGREGVVASLAFFALSEHLIYYSSELKTYGCDAAIATGLLLMAVVVSRDGMTTRRMLVLMVLGAVSLLFSTTSLFVLAGIGLTGLFQAWRGGVKPACLRWVLTGIVWIAALGLYYAVLLHHIAGLPILQSYWRAYFMPVPPTSLHDLAWFLEAFKALFDKPAGLALPGLGALAFVVGAVSLWRRKRVELIILLSPIAMTLAASALHKYPFGDRLILFLAAPVILIVAEGITATALMPSPRGRLIGVTMGLLLLVHPAHVAASRFVHPREIQELRPLLDEIEEKHQAGDVLYAYQHVEERVRLYVDVLKMFPLDDMTVVSGVNEPDQWSSPMGQFRPWCGKRVWFVFSHVRPGEEAFMLYHLDQLGTRLDTLAYTGASAYLYDLTGEGCSEDDGEDGV